LKKLGAKGETYDDILRRLIQLAEQATFVERQKRILTDEKFIPLADV